LEFSADDLDFEVALDHLHDKGYVVIENVLKSEEVDKIRNDLDDIMEKERENPFDPGDGPEMPNDSEIKSFIEKSYKTTDSERKLLMKRIRYTRAQNHNTPWPVSPEQLNQQFFHVPSFSDEGRSQRVFNLPAKLDGCDRLIGNPILMKLSRSVLGDDCVLSDISSQSIGTNSDGGYWHVDSPLTLLPEPLPDFFLALQNVWMLDDFTAENGSTRIVPGSHKTRKKPAWNYETIDGEKILTGPAGSLALWTSHLWHKSGPNFTTKPRRSFLGYYTRSWIKPFSDYSRSIPTNIIEKFSPEVRYLIGFSATAPIRG
tara:strand:+ start:189 stop:1133 length:945 start_codon:yes stop_codon:yes gene_type:complete